VPEGDTIHNTAERLRRALVGRPLVRFEATRVPGRHPQPGTAVVAVEARGKHLLIDFSDGLTLQTHLRMTGRWHLYRPGERWRKPAHLARALVEVDEWVAVCFSAPLVRLVVEPGPELGRLGPDLCRADADLDRCLRRLAGLAEPGTEIADVLLDQRIACGVGNVYKSEVCFVCGVHPSTPVEQVDIATRRRLLEAAARLLRANLGPGPRSTVPGRPGALAVYGRARQPCRRCAAPVRLARTGPQARVTYWCPTCQPALPPKREGGG